MILVQYLFPGGCVRDSTKLLPGFFGESWGLEQDECYLLVLCRREGICFQTPQEYLTWDSSKNKM